MTDDGAHIGVGAERALKTILGGEGQPTEAERRTPQQMAEYLLAPSSGEMDYDEAARVAGGIVLRYLQRHPEDAELEPYDDYTWPDGFDGPSVISAHGIKGQMERKEPKARAALSDLGLTGFLFGWACNAAKYALGLPPVPNPAIVEIPDD